MHQLEEKVTKHEEKKKEIEAEFKACQDSLESNNKLNSEKEELLQKVLHMRKERIKWEK